MTLWLAARRWHLCVGSVVVVTVALALLGARSVPVPALLEGLSLPVPLSVFLPLALAVAVTSALAAGDPSAEAAGRRALPGLDALFALASVLLLLGLLAAFAPVLDPGVAATAGRNAAGYLGLALLAGAFLGVDVASSLPVVLAIAATLFGRQAGDDVAWWAWPVAPGGDRGALTFGAVLLAAGALVTAASGSPLLRNPTARRARALQ